MSEAYWVAGGPENPADLLVQSGVRAAHVDVLHWLLPADQSPLPALAAVSTFCWPVEPLLQHAVLNFAAQSLAGSIHGLALLTGGGTSTLLASPRAVGRDNLMPHARLGPFWSHPGTGDTLEWLQPLVASLSKLEFPEEALRLFSVIAEPEEKMLAAFPKAEWLHSQAGLLDRLNSLVHRLEESQAQLGLLLSLPSGGPWLATLVERI